MSAKVNSRTLGPAQAGGGRHTLYVDGACPGNPGPMGAGAVLLSPGGVVIAQGCWPLGEGTNNRAEYMGLINGLRLALEHGVNRLLIRMDSELVVRQVEGEYQVKKPHLKPLYKEVMELLRGFSAYGIQHVPRELNGQADALANQAINQRKEE